MTSAIAKFRQKPHNLIEFTLKQEKENMKRSQHMNFLRKIEFAYLQIDDSNSVGWCRKLLTDIGHRS